MAAIKRIVSTDFWTDTKVDDFSPEDKYFMLYLMTNPFTTQLGIYELSVRQAAFQLGYSQEAVMVLLDRFQNKYGLILYSKETSEVAIKNYLRHSIVKGGKPVEDCLRKEMQAVKDKRLIYKVFKHISGYEHLNSTVLNIISSFNIVPFNDNDNDNDNERIVLRIVDESSAGDVLPPNPNKPSGGKPDAEKAESLSFDYSTTTFSPALISKIEQWLQYKKERRQTYKPTGLQALISEIQNNVNTYGEPAVIDLIQKCMSANYQGIIFDKLKKQAEQQLHGRGNTGFQTSNPFMEMYEEKRGNG